MKTFHLLVQLDPKKFLLITVKHQLSKKLPEMYVFNAVHNTNYSEAFFLIF